MRWASSTTTRSQSSDASRLRSGSRRAVANEAITTASGSSVRGPSIGTSSGTEVSTAILVVRQPSRVATIVGQPNFRSSSSPHCPTSPVGARTRTLVASPRCRSSVMTIPASMVLPSPTSSARIARPFICLRTTLAALSW